MVGVVKKSNGREGYRKPDAKRDRLGFKLSLDQLTLIEKHRFEGELTSELLHRLLRRLSTFIQYGNSIDWILTVEYYPRVSGGISLNLDPEVADLVAQNWKGSGQETADYLLTFAASFSPTFPITTADEAFNMLSQFQGQRIPVSDAIDTLAERCSRISTLQYLDDLIQDGRVRAIDVQGRCPVKRAQLPSGKRLAYIELAASDPHKILERSSRDPISGTYM